MFSSQVVVGTGIINKVSCFFYTDVASVLSISFAASIVCLFLLKIKTKKGLSHIVASKVIYCFVATL